MKFTVCVKLTPDTEQLADVKLDDIGSDDLGVTMVLNPWDEFAVEEALQLKERYEEQFEVTTTVITLGNANAAEALKRAVAMGVEEAVLLSDPAFDGSDAWGTAHILAQAIRKMGDYNLILTGRQSVDGNSGLIGPGLAAKLGLPFVSQVARVVELNEESVTVKRALDEGVQTVRVKLPAVLAVSKEINEPRYPNFMGIRKASRMQYPAVKAKDLPGLNKAQIGEDAALVKWTNLRKPPARTGKCEFITGATAAEQAAILADKLIAEKVI
jgi:electron transfer flavoprotein beta subunit